MMEPTTTYTPSPTRYDTMTYNRCGNSGLKLPAISLGCWHNFGDHTPFETMRQLTRTAFDHGITHFDLANNYGPEPGSAERNASSPTANSASSSSSHWPDSSKPNSEHTTAIGTVSDGLGLVSNR